MTHLSIFFKDLIALTISTIIIMLAYEYNLPILITGFIVVAVLSIYASLTRRWDKTKYQLREEQERYTPARNY